MVLALARLGGPAIARREVGGRFAARVFSWGQRYGKASTRLIWRRSGEIWC
jgi:hypothetical protein